MEAIKHKQIEVNMRQGEAKKIAKEEGGRLPYIKELIFTIKNSEQFEKWIGQYWVSDRVLWVKNGFYRIDYAKLSLEKISENVWERLPDKERAHIRYGVIAIGEKADIHSEASMSEGYDWVDARATIVKKLQTAELASVKRV